MNVSFITFLAVIQFLFFNSICMIKEEYDCGIFVSNFFLFISTTRDTKILYSIPNLWQKFLYIPFEYIVDEIFSGLILYVSPLSSSNTILGGSIDKITEEILSKSYMTGKYVMSVVRNKCRSWYWCLHYAYLNILN